MHKLDHSLEFNIRIIYLKLIIYIYIYMHRNTYKNTHIHILCLTSLRQVPFFFSFFFVPCASDNIRDLAPRVCLVPLTTLGVAMIDI